MGRPATHHEERKAAIVEAALEVFARNGYDGTSNRQIARAAGLNSAALIYHYFPSKTDLFQECLHRVAVLEDLHQEIARGQEQPPEVYLRRVGLTYLKVLQTGDTSHLVLMMLTATQSHPELLPILMERLTEAVVYPMFTYFSRHMESSELKPLPAASAAQQFMGGLFFRGMIVSLIGKVLPFPLPTDEEYLENYVKVFLEGLKSG